MKYCFVAYFFATVHISCFRSFPILSCSKEALISSPTRKILRYKFVLSHSSSLVDVRQVDPEIVKLKWATVDFDVPTSLKECLNKFFRHPSSVIISTILFAIVGARLQMNSAISTIEIFSGVATTIFWIAQEWFLHKYLLQQPLMSPLKPGIVDSADGVDADTQSSNRGWMGYHIHNSHHEIPYYHVSIDPPFLVLAWGTIFSALINVLVSDSEIMLPIMFSYFTMGLVYEWTHFLAHTRYKPRSWLGRYSMLSYCCVFNQIGIDWQAIYTRSIKNNHMRHHLVDKQKWFAFTVPLVDHLMGTAGDRGEE